MTHAHLRWICVLGFAHATSMGFTVRPCPPRSGAPPYARGRGINHLDASTEARRRWRPHGRDHGADRRHRPRDRAGARAHARGGQDPGHGTARVRRRGERVEAHRIPVGADVLDRESVDERFVAGADVVVHLAFLIFGGHDETREINDLRGSRQRVRGGGRGGREETRVTRPRSPPTDSTPRTRTCSRRRRRHSARRTSITPRRRRSSKGFSPRSRRGTRPTSTCFGPASSRDATRRR